MAGCTRYARRSLHMDTPTHMSRCTRTLDRTQPKLGTIKSTPSTSTSRTRRLDMTTSVSRLPRPISPRRLSHASAQCCAADRGRSLDHGRRANNQQAGRSTCSAHGLAAPGLPKRPWSMRATRPSTREVRDEHILPGRSREEKPTSHPPTQRTTSETPKRDHAAARKRTAHASPRTETMHLTLPHRSETHETGSHHQERGHLPEVLGLSANSDAPIVM